MSMKILWRAVQGHLHNLMQEFWPDSPEEQTKAEIGRLGSDLSRRYQRLIQLRQRIEQVRGRLDAQKRRQAEFTGEAGRRRSIERLSERLARLEGAYQDRRRQLERRKRLREDLVSGRAQVVEVIHRAGGSEAF
jgi:chromosome segregation ATPase